MTFLFSDFERLLLQVVTGEVECHKLLLAAANPVFNSLFYGPTAVTANRVEVKVQIPP